MPEALQPQPTLFQRVTGYASPPRKTEDQGAFELKIALKLAHFSTDPEVLRFLVVFVSRYHHTKPVFIELGKLAARRLLEDVDPTLESAEVVLTAFPQEKDLVEMADNIPRAEK